MTTMKRILIIEDEKDLAEMIKVTLEKAGYSVDLAGDGEEGLNKAKILEPDLITLNILMPKIDGIDVCRQLKSDEKCRHIPILMITVRKEKEYEEKAFAAGADDYLTKAYDRDILISKIKALLKE